MATFEKPNNNQERGNMYSLGLIDSSGNPTSGNSFSNSGSSGSSGSQKANTNASAGNSGTVGNSGTNKTKTTTNNNSQNSINSSVNGNSNNSQTNKSAQNSNISNSSNVNKSLKTVYTDSDLSSSGQAKIKQAKEGWANSKNDDERRYWADQAQKAANAEGYYRSDDGSQMYRIDQDYVDKKVKELSNAWYATNDPAEKERLHNEAEYYRGLLGYSGGADGSQRITKAPTTNPYTNQQIPNYTGMTPQQKYAAAQSAGDTYGMAEAANDAFRERWQQGYYGGVDGSTRTNIQPVISQINQLQAQLNEATSRNDAKAATQIQQQIKDRYNSIGMIVCEDGQVIARTELNLRIEQDKKDWWTKNDAGDYEGAQAAHDDAVWCSRQLGFNRNQDGTVLTPINSNAYSINDRQNNLVQANVENGNPVSVLNPDGSVNTNYRGILNMSGTDANYQQYIVTTGEDGGQVFIGVTGTPTDFLIINPDGSINQNRVTDTQGNILSTSRFVFGEDDRTYDKTTGKSLVELASEYGLDPTNFVQKITDENGNTRFYNLYGEEVTGRLNAAQKQSINDYEQESLNDMTNAFLGAGFNNVPQWNDYDSLTWDQALAMAEEQVNGAFSKQLDTTLDKLNTSALQTGFYGQLPAEQLRQNAIAESEVERQQAIYELANQLQAASQTEAQRQFTDAMQTSQQRLNTVVTVFQQLYQYVRDKVSDMQQEEQFEIQRGNQNIQREANRLQAFMGTFEAWANLMGYAIQATVPTQSGTSPQAVNAVNKYGSMDISKWGDQFIKNTLATMS
jgi:hypothetical protein